MLSGHEAFAGFLIEFLPNFFSIPRSFDLYIALEYGDNQRTRPIGFDFAKRYGLYVREINAVEQEIQATYRQGINEKAALIEQEFEQRKKIYAFCIIISN
jgi:hypothetical protein